MRMLALVVVTVVLFLSGCAVLVNGETRGNRMVQMAVARNLRPENVKYFAPGAKTIIVEASGGAEVSVQDSRSQHSGYRYGW